MQKPGERQEAERRGAEIPILPWSSLLPSFLSHRAHWLTQRVFRLQGEAGAGSRVGERETKVPEYSLKQNENKQARYVISLHNPVANKHISNQTASGILQIEVTVPAFKGLLVWIPQKQWKAGLEKQAWAARQEEVSMTRESPSGSSEFAPESSRISSLKFGPFLWLPYVKQD